jgi:hypothetical protein
MYYIATGDSSFVGMTKLSKKSRINENAASFMV